MTAALIISSFTSPAIAQNVTTEFIKLLPTLSDAGWGAYVNLNNSFFSAILVAPNISLADANMTLVPFVQSVEEATSGLVQVITIPFPSFYEFYLTVFSGIGQVGSQVEIASRLLPRSLAENDPAKAAKIMLSLGPVGINSVAGGLVSRIDPDSTGLNPSWRKALSEVYIVATWPESSTADFVFQRIEEMKQSTLILDQLTTDSGSYLNEGSLYELDFKKSYFGTHYDKLELIKNKYDPSSLFVVASGVGSDKWDRDLTCRRHAER